MDKARQFKSGVQTDTDEQLVHALYITTEGCVKSHVTSLSFGK